MTNPTLACSPRPARIQSTSILQSRKLARSGTAVRGRPHPPDQYARRPVVPLAWQVDHDKGRHLAAEIDQLLNRLDRRAEGVPSSCLASTERRGSSSLNHETLEQDRVEPVVVGSDLSSDLFGIEIERQLWC